MKNLQKLLNFELPRFSLHVFLGNSVPFFLRNSSLGMGLDAPAVNIPK